MGTHAQSRARRGVVQSQARDARPGSGCYRRCRGAIERDVGELGRLPRVKSSGTKGYQPDGCVSRLTTHDGTVELRVSERPSHHRPRNSVVSGRAVSHGSHDVLRQSLHQPLDRAGAIGRRVDRSYDRPRRACRQPHTRGALRQVLSEQLPRRRVDWRGAGGGFCIQPRTESQESVQSDRRDVPAGQRFSEAHVARRRRVRGAGHRPVSQHRLLQQQRDVVARAFHRANRGDTRDLPANGDGCRQCIDGERGGTVRARSAVAVDALAAHRRCSRRKVHHSLSQ